MLGVTFKFAFDKNRSLVEDPDRSDGVFLQQFGVYLSLPGGGFQRIFFLEIQIGSNAGPDRCDENGRTYPDDAQAALFGGR